jgi:hypothetical protein
MLKAATRSHSATNATTAVVVAAGLVGREHLAENRERCEQQETGKQKKPGAHGLDPPLLSFYGADDRPGPA